MAEFGYESNARGILQQGVRFLFAPQAAFITDPDLDFTLVALNESSEDGRAMLSNYGFLRLDPGLHKVDEYEFVTIIQHPNGDEKYIAIRENKVIKIGDKVDVERDNLLWYASDTAQGSSGAPVLNDSWQVVALHSRGVPETRENNGATEYQLVTGEWVPKEDAEQLPDDRLKWIANEGIRISRIIARIAEKHTAQGSVQSPLVHDLLDDAGGVRTFAGTLPKESVVGPTTILPPVALPQVTPQVTLEDMAFERGISKYIRELNYYDGREGYDPEFLGVNIALPEITPVALRFGSPAPVEGTDDGVLRYTHFSVVFNQQRKLAFFTAVNIDGERWRSLNRGVDKWYYDPRIQIDLQVGDELYGGEPGSLGQKGWFDRGHLVRRLDPVWGSLETATLADNDTFHWTNCSPQYWAFNQGSEFWQGLENYILYNSEEENVRATVFTGPVFQENDEVHRGVQIPQYFWKVVVVRDGAGWLYSSAYVVGQAQYATNITFEELPIRNFNNFQVSLSHLEEQTGLRFPDNVREADVLGPNAEDRPLRSLGDIVHPRRPGKKSPPPGTPVPQPPTREGPLAAQSQASSNPL
jgi:endonuclease G